MGKGKTFQNHAGNIAMQALVGLHLPEYIGSQKLDKVNVVMKVCAIIKSSGGHILKKDPNNGLWWVHATLEEVHDKISKNYLSEQTKAKYSNKKTIQTVQKFNSKFHPKRSREEDEFNCFCGCNGLGDGFQLPKRQKRACSHMGTEYAASFGDLSLQVQGVFCDLGSR